MWIPNTLNSYMVFLGWPKNLEYLYRSLQTPVTHEPLHISWEEVIHKRVMTSDTVDIGDVERVGNEFIVVRQGVGNPTLYYIPKSFIDNYDGSCLYIAVTKWIGCWQVCKRY